MQNNNPLQQQDILKDWWESLVDINKQYFATIWALIVKPGSVVYTYLFVDRKQYVNPFKLLIFNASVVFFIAAGYSQVIMTSFESGKPIEADRMKERIAAAEKIKDALQYGPLLYALVYAPTLALGTWLLFKKALPSFLYHVIWNAYATAISLLFNATGMLISAAYLNWVGNEIIILGIIAAVCLWIPTSIVYYKIGKTFSPPKNILGQVKLALSFLFSIVFTGTIWGMLIVAGHALVKIFV